MSKKQVYSRRFHVAILFCFFLPFFYTGCDEEKSSTSNVDSTSVAIADTILPSISKNDSIEQVETKPDTLDSGTATLDTDTGSTTKAKKDNDNPARLISENIPALSPLLMPDSNTYTGIGTIINLLPLFIFYSIVISFLFLLVGLVVKYMEPSSRKTVLLIEGMALLMLSVSRAFDFNSEYRWGYWLTLIALLFLTLYDFYILRQGLKQKKAEE